MRREDLLASPVEHIKIKPKMTVNELMLEFEKSGSFGAGRLAAACNIFEKMLRDEGCTIFLALAGAAVPAGLRTVIADLIRKRQIDALVTTAANMVHDFIEALGGHHYKGHWAADDVLLYQYHVYRIYDIFVPEEDFVKMDYHCAEMFTKIAEENAGKTLSSNELAWEMGKRLSDPNSILRAAYEEKVPIFMPALRDSEFGYIHWLHSQRNPQNTLKVDAFKEVGYIIEMFRKSPRNGMIVLGGGVPRNTVQHAAVTARKGIDYAIVLTMDRAETGGLSGSTLEETVSWGKLKKDASKIMVIGDMLITFPIIVAAVNERLGENYTRTPALTRIRSKIT
ncbi:deoxyhypusine synthase [Candidatus Bathyarchaeota archaeon]|nr:MAG: deoxyhypusine synthase [Candidatus Bathyarchaeota archaeon]